ncbi:MAG: hypothetical protein Q7U47_14215 [Paludibacter sp.]|nr:hypothetical protein [Paludibacter sp.]
MNDKKLLASVALFGQLYNSTKYTNISGIIAEFIKGAIVLNNKYSLTSYELKNLLKETYDFNLLESIIKTVIYSNLKDIVDVENKVFNFNDSIKEQYKTLENELEKVNQINDSIFNGLINYISVVEKKELSDIEKLEIHENFSQFLFENGTSDNYSNHISSYIIKNETDTSFVNSLNEIREGLILYHGIRYTADINELGTWKNNMVIYLNTEYLFSAIKYNGILYKEIFDDFYNLVCEINAHDEKISLKYFPETMEEIECFFSSAESILKGDKKLLPWKTAMKKIVDSCKSPSDVVALKVDFYSKLENLGIVMQEFDYEINEYADFNVVDENVIEKLKSISKEKKMKFDEESCYYFFNIFTKVNFFRKGYNNKPFNKIGHIFISDSGFAKYLGHNNSVKFENSDTTFAKDLDFVTTQFWIELKKGFSGISEFPKSFNVLTKAKIIISSHINSSMSKEFDQLVKDTEQGKITKEEALARSYALRLKPNLPIEVTHENIDETFDFLNNENHLADIYQEQIKKDELVKETQQRNIELQQEIERRNIIDRERDEKERKEREAKMLAENKKKYAAEMDTFKQNLNSHLANSWRQELKNTKWHFWKYLIFVVIAVALIFILIAMRDSLLTSLNIIITEKVKLYYSGLVTVIGFIATAIRSFFDTKNILFALTIIFSNKSRNAFKDKKLTEFETDFRVNNREPKME